MKHSFLTLLTAAALTVGASSMYAIGKGKGPSGTCTNCPNGGVPKRDGTGPGMQNGKQNGSQNGPGMKGQRTGPRDGSGPIHTPSQQGRRGRR